MQFIYSYNMTDEKGKLSLVISFNLTWRGPPRDVILIQRDEGHMPARQVLEVVVIATNHQRGNALCWSSLCVGVEGTPAIFIYLTILTVWTAW